jgi:ADP-heptose:LPS heptosyltransferase
MRLLDRWVGIPICGAGTWLAKLTRWRARPDHPPRNVLFIGLAEMGVAVLALPAIEQLRQQLPDCRIFFLVFAHLAESVHVLRAVPPDQILTIRADSLTHLAADTASFVRTARRCEIDTVLVLEPFARFSAVLAAMSGASRRVGFHPFHQPGAYVGDLFTHPVGYNPHLHASQSFLALVHALREPAGRRPMGKGPAAPLTMAPMRTPDAAALAHIGARLAARGVDPARQRIIVVNPNESQLVPLRKWPLDRYVALIARLLRDERHVCVLIGSAGERVDARFIVEWTRHERLIDWTGQTSLEEVVALFHLAQVLVSNDSGPAHLAALTPVHVVVFFGPETPELFRPITDRCTVLYAGLSCSPCVSVHNQRRSRCDDNLCLQHFDVDRVHGIVLDALERAGPPAPSS